MAVEVIMPQMGESIFEGTITKWLKKPGDAIERDEPLFEISTDKVDAEIPSPAAGVLKEIRVEEGKTVPIQTVVALIEALGAQASPVKPAATRSSEAPSKPPADAGRVQAPAASKTSEQRPEQAPQPLATAPEAAASEEGAEEEAATARRERIRHPPAARRLARVKPNDLSTIDAPRARGGPSPTDGAAPLHASPRPTAA